MRNLDQSAIIDSDNNQLTLRNVLVASLIANREAPKEIKLLQYDLSKKIYDNTEPLCEVSYNEAELLKASLLLNLSSVVYSQAIDCLSYKEPNSAAEFKEIPTLVEEAQNGV
jgi:hypothetical protein